MTAPHRRSRGDAHSLAVKRGIRRMQEEWEVYKVFPVKKADKKANRASRWVGMVGGLSRLLGRINVPIPTPDEIEQELRAAYKRGYIQALRDALRERNKQEQSSYRHAMPTPSYQDLKAMSHVYDIPT